jgi:alpha-galactosidase/6-phospho-beta-glucosidase family protein
MFHTLRNLPPLIDIARAMEKFCPDALLLNYTNPEAKLVEMVSKLTKIKAIGLCHGDQMGVDQLSMFLRIPKEDLDKLFKEGLPPEELNRDFQYLEELRELKTHHPKEYRRIEKMNLRCRTGRNAQTIDNKFLTNTSLVFLKAGKSTFFLVNDTKTEELSALQAIDLFRAEKDEPKALRIENHHSHVKKAEQTFKSDIQTAYSKQTSATAAGQQVSTALAFVRNLKSAINDPEQVLKVDQLMKMIEWGTLTPLAKQILEMDKKVQKRIFNREDCLNQIVKMANAYNSYYLDEQREKSLETPCIILSESFN